MWRLGFLVVVSVLLFGCSSTPAGTHATATAAGGNSPFDPLPPGITVKDSYTPVLVQVNNPPSVPVAGTDGKFHVAYTLLLQNASQVPATIRKLDVVDATPARFSPRSAAGNCWTLRAISVTATVSVPSCHAGDRLGDPAPAGAGAVRRLRLQLC